MSKIFFVILLFSTFVFAETTSNELNFKPIEDVAVTISQTISFLKNPDNSLKIIETEKETVIFNIYAILGMIVFTIFSYSFIIIYKFKEFNRKHNFN